MKKPKNHTKLGMAPSLRAAASRCGVTLRVVQSAKDAGCDAISTAGRVDCDKLLEWLLDHPEAIHDASERISKDKETVLKIRAERLLKEHILREREGQYVDILDVQKLWGDAIMQAKKILLSGPSSLAPQVVGVSVVEAEKLLRDWLHESLSKLSADPVGKKDQSAV